MTFAPVLPDGWTLVALQSAGSTNDEAARLAEGESWDEFARALQVRGRARLRVACRVPLASGTDACVMHARFVAIVAQ